MTERRETSDIADPNLIVKLVAAITLVDLIGATLVRLYIGDAPVVMGDVAKVGIGGLVMAGGMRAEKARRR